MKAPALAKRSSTKRERARSQKASKAGSDTPSTSARRAELGPIDGAEELADRFAVEGQPTRHALVGDHRQRPKVGLRIGFLRAHDVLGTHVGRRSRQRPRRGEQTLVLAVALLGNAKIEDLHEELAALLLVLEVHEEQVVRLEIAMDDPLLVGLAQRPTTLPDELCRLVRRQPTLPREPIEQALALEQLHHHVGHVIDDAVIKRAYDVRGLDVRGDARLALEPRDEGAVGPREATGDEFHRDVGVQGRVAADPDAPHRAFAERPNQLDGATDSDAGTELHRSLHGSRDPGARAPVDRLCSQAVMAFVRAWLVAVALLLAATPARAQTADEGAIPPEQADALFDRALKLMKEQRFGEACPLLEKANELDPTSGTAFNLARCHEVIGKTASAAKGFETAVSLAEVESKLDRAEAAQRALDNLMGRLSLLVIDVPEGARVSGLAVTKGGDPVPEETWGKEVAVDPARYVVEASAPGYEPFREEVEIPIGPARETVTVKLAPIAVAPDPAPASPPEPEGFQLGTWHYVGIGVGGLGVVGLVVGGVLGGMAISKNGDSEALCRPEDPSRCTQEGKDLRDQAFSLATGSTASLRDRRFAFGRGRHPVLPRAHDGGGR